VPARRQPLSVGDPCWAGDCLWIRNQTEIDSTTTEKTTEDFHAPVPIDLVFFASHKGRTRRLPIYLDGFQTRSRHS
jgi:hypothetical protein